MAIPNKAVGYGNNSTARNVFSATFSAALASQAKYEMYDNAQAFPATGTATTTAEQCFAGTAGNSNKPMYSLVDTTNAAPASAWKPATATAGTANPNRMKGTTNYVTQAGSAPGAGGRITWNMVFEVPSDASAGSSGTQADLLLRYTYTGGAPTVAWFFNEGTEGVPTWTQLTPGTHGTRHCDAGTVSGGPYLLSIPGAGTADSAEGWTTA